MNRPYPILCAGALLFIVAMVTVHKIVGPFIVARFGITGVLVAVAALVIVGAKVDRSY